MNISTAQTTHFLAAAIILIICLKTLIRNTMYILI